MATNFTIKEHKPAKATTKAHYIVEREHEKKEHIQPGGVHLAHRIINSI